MTEPRDRPTHVLAVSGFVTNDNGDVLLVRTLGRGWELPGGQVETGEGLLAVPEAAWFAADEARRLVTRSPAAERIRDALGPNGGLRHRTYRMPPYEALVEGFLASSRGTERSTNRTE